MTNRERGGGGGSVVLPQTSHQDSVMTFLLQHAPTSINNSEYPAHRVILHCSVTKDSPLLFLTQGFSIWDLPLLHVWHHSGVLLLPDFKQGSCWPPQRILNGLLLIRDFCDWIATLSWSPTDSGSWSIPADIWFRRALTIRRSWFEARTQRSRNLRESSSPFRSEPVGFRLMQKIEKLVSDRHILVTLHACTIKKKSTGNVYAWLVDTGLEKVRKTWCRISIARKSSTTTKLPLATLINYIPGVSGDPEAWSPAQHPSSPTCH